MSDWAMAPHANLMLIAGSCCAAVLMLSAIGHLRTGALRYELAAHGVVAVRLRRFVSAGVTVAEGLLALVLIGSLILSGPVLRVALGLSAALFACYLGYALAVAFRAQDEPTGCGCGVGEHPMGIATAVRAAGLAVLAIAGALSSGSPLRVNGLFISILMSISVVCLIVWLPVSLSRPGQLTAEQN